MSGVSLNSFFIEKHEWGMCDKHMTGRDYFMISNVYLMGHEQLIV